MWLLLLDMLACVRTEKAIVSWQFCIFSFCFAIKSKEKIVAFFPWTKKKTNHIDAMNEQSRLNGLYKLYFRRATKHLPLITTMMTSAWYHFYSVYVFVLFFFSWTVVRLREINRNTWCTKAHAILCNPSSGTSTKKKTIKYDWIIWHGKKKKLWQAARIAESEHFQLDKRAHGYDSNHHEIYIQPFFHSVCKRRTRHFTVCTSSRFRHSSE